MKVYAAMYCPCIHESAFTVLSLHMTREGAVEAVEKHKRKERRAQKIYPYVAYDTQEMEVKP